MLILLLSSCREDDTPEADNGPRIINPWMNEEDRINTIQNSVESEENSYLIPMIEISADEHVVMVEDINLDNDTEEEQIILTSLRDEEGAEQLKLYVADYSNDQVRYLTALEETISPVNTDGISVYLQDMTGNHRQELVITGFNSENNQTLDAFTITSQGAALSYRRIVQLTANGTIEIQSSERSENYEGGITTWESFPVTTEESASIESGSLDLTRTVYSWNRAASRYQPASVVQIPGSSIREENLKELYRGDVDDFKEFLRGPWHRVTDLHKVKQPYLEEILYFQPEENNVIFTIDDVQEIYNWEDTYRTIFKGIHIQTENLLISSLKRNISISVEDVDSIHVRILGSEEWGGFYEPVSKTVQQSLVNNDRLEPIEELNQLSGLYRTSQGNEIYLDYPFFTEKQDNGERKGIYNFVNIYGTSVLQLRYQKDNGLLENRASFEAEYQQTEDSTRIIRTLTLTPGILSAGGFLQQPGDSVHMEQIEVREQS